MKKIVLLVLLSLGVLPIYAQTSFGILAGLNIANQRVGNEIPGVTRNPIVLWRAGIAADVPLAANFYLQPQLLVSAKGGKSEQRHMAVGDGTFFDANAKVSLVYLELPLNLVYKFPLGPGKLLAGAGPYIAYGLGGSSSAIAVLDNGEAQHIDYNVKFRNESGPVLGDDGKIYLFYRPWDVGANILTGYEFNNGLSLNINYSLGLTNISPSDLNTLKNHYFGITVGYFLRKSK